MRADSGDCVPELLPARIDADMTVGPGCVTLDRTDVMGATLTIQPGTDVRVLAGGYLNVGSGVLIARGGADDPIIFRSDAASPAPGDWECLRLGVEAGSDATAGASELSFVQIHHGGAGCSITGSDKRAALQVFTNVRELSNLTLTESASAGLYFDGDVRSFHSNTFARNGGPSIQARFEHLLSLTGPNTFEDPGDHILVDTSLSLDLDGTWSAQAAPYRLDGAASIGGVVTVEAGTTIEMASLIEVFGGTLNAAGTAAAPVTFTSPQVSPIAGDWGCVWAAGGTFDHTVFEFGGAGCGGANVRALLVADDSTRVTNSVFRESPGDGIRGYFATDTTCPTWCTTNTFETITGSPILCGGSGTTPVTCP